MPFGRKSPLEALALPGVILAYKYSQFRQRRREAASRRVTERELAALHYKIDELLSRLEESEPDPPTSQEDECVICINARATMQTSPCGHRVVCRRCFVKTIQSAVAQRLLPLRCVICRERVNRLTSSSGTWRIQESASSYSMGAKSWSSAGVAAGGVSASASSYSMGDPAFHHQPSLHGKCPNGRVAQSASLYSMSSTGSSSGLSGVSHMSAYSKTSSISSTGLCSTPVSPISPSATSYTTPASSSSTSSVLNNHLAPPQASSHSISQHSSLSPSGGSGTVSSSSSLGGSLSPRGDSHHTHSHHAGCPSGCSGAIPRKPLNSLSNSSSSGSCSSAGSGSTGNVASFNSFPPSTHTYPGRRHTKGRLMDLQNRLPPIKEFRSPAKVPHPSPVYMSKFRYSSFTKSAKSTHEIVPLLGEPPSPPRRPLNIIVSSSLTALGPPPLKAGGAKIGPMRNAIAKNSYLASKDKRANCSSNNSNTAKANASNKTNAATSHCNNSSNGGVGNNKKLLHDMNANAAAKAAAAAAKTTTTTATINSKTHSQHTSSSSRSFPLFTSSNHKEKADNKKNESVERKKKEEKLKMKTEKEARKEEKRLAKEEERLAKIIAKEEKKKGKKESKELLIANDGNNKK